MDTPKEEVEVVENAADDGLREALLVMAAFLRDIEARIPIRETVYF
jgi:hypothetical protein